MDSAVREGVLESVLRLLWPSPPWPLRYLIAVALTVAVAVVKLAFPESGEQSPGLLLTIPVAVSAVLAGLGPALVATAGATAVIAFFLPPVMAFAITEGVSVMSLMAFLVEGLVISLLGAGLRAALLRSLGDLRRLEELQRERSALVATVTHEFRNPLAALSSHLQLAARYVARDDLRSRLPRSIEVASAQVTRLLRLTEDLLVVATAEDRSVRIDTTAIDLARVADAAAARASAIDASRPIWCAPTSDRAIVMGDGARLDQILDNLLKNALRYSPPGSSVQLTVHADGSRRMGVVRVRDQGHGIDPRERERIFDRFVRGTAARAVAGSGIGLYVSRELARRMGGRLVLEESAATGSVFAIELPLAPPEIIALDTDFTVTARLSDAGEEQPTRAN